MLKETLQQQSSFLVIEQVMVGITVSLLDGVIGDYSLLYDVKR